MGRGRRLYYGSSELPQDRGKPGTTESSVTKFADSSLGPVAGMMWSQRLIEFDADGEMRISKPAVKQAAKTIREQVVSTREYDKETFTNYAVESTGLTRKRAINATNREYAARAKAVLIAAKAGGVELSPADKRILNPLAEGRFTETVYGKEGQHDEGTLKTRLRARSNAGRMSNSSDPAQRARAREMAANLREYRYERYVA